MTLWKEYLINNYFKPGVPGAFAGPKKLYNTLKQNKQVVTLSQVRKWLRDQDAYSLLQPVKYKFQRQRIITRGIDDMWDVDLADMSNIANANEGNHFLLIVIDVFSRYLWVQPIPDKSHQSVIQAFQRIFQQTHRRPRTLRSDNGTEFKNRWVKQFFKKKGIHAYTTKNEVKANYAERVIRTLKGMMYRYFLHHQTYRYTNVLQDLVSNYNHRPHSSLPTSPANVTKDNESKLWKHLYIDKMKLKKPKRKNYKFKIGQHVRISHLKYVFQRDYHIKWTQEVFIITHRCKKQGIHLYRVKDFLDEDIDGHFYEEELQAVTKDIHSVYKIEQVLKTRKRQGIKEVFVKWLGWPKKFNSWIKESDIQAAA
jgi:transposase InsO family protein